MRVRTWAPIAPQVCLVGHFDKLVMNKGEQAMRREFDRLLPLMRSGGFIPKLGRTDDAEPDFISLGKAFDASNWPLADSGLLGPVTRCIVLESQIE